MAAGVSRSPLSGSAVTRQQLIDLQQHCSLFAPGDRVAVFQGHPFVVFYWSRRGTLASGGFFLFKMFFFIPMPDPLWEQSSRILKHT